MKMITVVDQPATIAAEAVLVLSADQHDRRRHQCVVLETMKDGKAVRVRLTAPTQFKIGEVFGMEGVVPKGLGSEADAAPPKPDKAEKAEKVGKAALEKARAEGVAEGMREGRAEGLAEGRRQMLAEVERRNALFEAEDGARDMLEAAEAALAAAGEGADLDALDAARLAAAETLARAEAAVAALEPLKA